MVQSLKQNSIHGAELKQRKQGAGQQKMHFCILSEKEQYPIEQVD